MTKQQFLSLRRRRSGITKKNTSSGLSKKHRQCIYSDASLNGAFEQNLERDLEVMYDLTVSRAQHQPAPSSPSSSQMVPMKTPPMHYDVVATPIAVTPTTKMVPLKPSSMNGTKPTLLKRVSSFTSTRWPSLNSSSKRGRYNDKSITSEEEEEDFSTLDQFADSSYGDTNSSASAISSRSGTYSHSHSHVPCNSCSCWAPSEEITSFEEMANQIVETIFPF